MTDGPLRRRRAGPRTGLPALGSGSQYGAQPRRWPCRCTGGLWSGTGVAPGPFATAPAGFPAGRETLPCTPSLRMASLPASGATRSGELSWQPPFACSASLPSPQPLPPVAKPTLSVRPPVPRSAALSVPLRAATLPKARSTAPRLARSFATSRPALRTATNLGGDWPLIVVKAAGAQVPAAFFLSTPPGRWPACSRKS